jgi:OmpA-OmpF porin, OOP family
MEVSMNTRVPTVSASVRSYLTPILLATLAFGLPASAQEPQPLPPVVVHAEGQKAKISGILVDRQGDKLRVREGDVATHTVLLTDETRISTPSGLFKMGRKKRDTTALLPGLMLQVDGHGSSDGTLVADEIHFSTRSMKVAQQINVGGEVVRAEVESNKDSIDAVKTRLADSISHVNARVTNLDKFEQKFLTTVNFPTDVYHLSAPQKSVLDDLVNRIGNLQGYVIEVRGYADDEGTSPYNLQLSAKRADAVVRYLIDEKGIPLRRIINPTGFGEANPVSSNQTPYGRAMNRRVSVRVMASKGAQ